MMLTRINATLLFCAFTALGQTRTITVDGGNGKTVALTLDDLARLPQQTVKTTDHDAPATFQGVLVSDVLARVDVPSGEKLRGKLMALYLLVEAADGYRAVFALPELDPAFTDHKVYLVFKRDGKPLSDKEGPFRIVIPDEKRPSRWVRQATALKIREAQ